jgi:hypothetical protein
MVFLALVMLTASGPLKLEPLVAATCRHQHVIWIAQQLVNKKGTIMKQIDDTTDTSTGTNPVGTPTPPPAPAPSSEPNKIWVAVAAVIVCLVIAAVLKQ